MSASDDKTPPVSIINSDSNSEKIICVACNSVCNTYKGLKRHVTKKHPEQAPYLIPNVRDTRMYKYGCDICTRQFNHICNLRYHMRKVHDAKTEEVKTENSKKCPLCNFQSFKVEMIKHFEDKHDIKIENVNLEFDDFDAFRSWKESIEKKENCKFISKWGVSSSSCSEKHYFVCHRSGIFISKGKGLRRTKLQGSNKIGGYCPSEIKVYINGNGACSIKFCKTHVGHKNDIGHLTLTDAERLSIAEKIALRIPFESILDEVRDSVNYNKLERIHLLSKKDLYNIEKAFNLRSNDTGHNDIPLDDDIPLVCDTELSSESPHSDIDAVSDCDGENKLSINEQEESATCETSILRAELSKTNENALNSTLLQEKEDLKREFLDILNNVSSEEDIKIVKNSLKSLRETLAAKRNLKMPFIPHKKICSSQ